MIGKVLGGRYEIVEQIGGGGMALVYKAKCRLLDRFVAIKILREEFVNDEEFVKKFRRESQAAARLSHPNIVNIYDVGVEEDENKQIYYIVMEYIKGKTLKEIIKEKGKLSIDLAIDYSYQIAEALRHAHSNRIFHRDIKPHNIMITDDNRVKVTDFGIARAATSSTVTTSSNVLGSVHYFSPEQARGGYTDDKSDIYSLGIVMYEMVTGVLPYQGESPITVALKHVQEDIVPPRELEESIPVGFENIILKAVQKKQADRYSNIGDLIRDLKKVKFNKEEPILNNNDNFDSHTKLMPAVNVEDDNMRSKKNIKKKKKRDGTLKVVFLGILLAFLLAFSIFFGYYKLKDYLVTEEVVVPDIIGLQEAEARKKIEDLGLRFVVKGTGRNDNFNPGEVIYQSVDANTTVKVDFPIEVLLNEGEALVKVPSGVNRDINDARDLMINANLDVEIEYEYSDTIPLDVVIKQIPESGSEVKPGSTVTLVVSQGEEVKYVTMENLVGKNIEEAKRIIEELDLVEGEISYQPSEEYEEGIVVWQSYEPGTELETKTAVDIYVSSGIEENTEEENIDGETGGEEVGSTEETPITFTLTPLQDREETSIKIIRIQDGVSQVVYNKKHKASDGVAIITLEGKVGALFEIYYDEIYQTTIPKED
ncbi:MAG: Stk1 family PASTA domain-containing Ser/Thr kinase [Tissierellia bacterium]|nr:Stk1 family PASTA domain-containing Ser/Thr kinase [Tissierellia bacterium]